MSAGQRQGDAENEKQPKRRAACDACRVKKLKCSGEHPTCSRCQREQIECVYSVQKTMGRPKKRRKSSDENMDEAALFAASSESAAAWQSTGEQSYTETGSSCPQAPMQAPYIALWGNTVVSPRTTSPWSNDLQPAHLDTSEESSPAAFSVPPELTEPYRYTRSTSIGTSNFTLDSSLVEQSGMQSNVASPPCACLSTMYLTLNDLSTMDTSASFPTPLHSLRAATMAAAEIVACQECPKRYFSGMQNTSAMSSLLMGITERYSKVLSNISAEADRATIAGEHKKFRLSDLQSSTSHLHAGGLGAVASFTVTLTPEEWRQMCKKVVRAEVFGPTDGNECCPYLAGVMDQMEKRQKHWHTCNRPGDDLPGAVPASMGGRAHDVDPTVLAAGENPLCLKMLGFSRHMLDQCDWS